MPDVMIDRSRMRGLVLRAGSHDSPEEGLCLTEAVAYITGEPHSDRPWCMSPVLASIGRRFNDRLPDDARQRLIPIIPDLVGTAGDGHDDARSYLALDWLVCTYLATVLELTPSCRGAAATLRALDPVVDQASAERASLAAFAAQRAASAAEDAAPTAWAVAWSVIATARDVLYPVVVATWGTTGHDPWNAVRDAALEAVWSATRNDAAWNALRPALTAMQDSMIDLYARMARVGATDQQPDHRPRPVESTPTRKKTFDE